MNDNKVQEQPLTVPSSPNLNQADKDKIRAAMERALAILRPTERLTVRWRDNADTEQQDGKA